MNVPPRVSVLMPVYDAGRYLAWAIESILAQSYSDFELLILDDASRDASTEIAARYAGRDARVRVRRGPHAGLTARLVEGLVEARGGYIARMDADDVSRPQRLARQVAYLDAHPECVAVGSEVLLVDPSGRPIRELGSPLAHEDIDAALLRGRSMTHAATTFRREALSAAGGYRTQHEPAEDVDLFLRLAEVGRLANLPEVLYEYRQHARNVCAERADEQQERICALLREAQQRRGLPETPRPERFVRGSEVDDWHDWARGALGGGHRATARHWALAVLRAEPARLRSWRLLFRALLGLRRPRRRCPD